MNIGELAKFRGGVSVDTISELTTASGVTIDSVLCKDGNVTALASGTVTTTYVKAADTQGLGLKNSSGTSVVTVTDAGAVTVGPSSGSTQVSHRIYAYSAAYTVGNATLTLDERNSGSYSPSIVFARNGTKSGRWSSEAGNPFSLYANDDTSVGYVTNAGAWTLGQTASSTASHIVQNNCSSDFACLITNANTGASADGLDVNVASATSTRAFRVRSGSTVLGMCTAAGAWTLGPSTKAASHVVYGDILFYDNGQNVVAIRSDEASGSSKQMIRFQLDGTTTACGGIAATSNAVSPAFYTGTSDSRFKEGIETASYVALDKLNKVRIVDFWLKGKTDVAKTRGVIAQELRAVYPEKVMEDAEGFLSVCTGYDYDLIKAVQELSAKLDEANARIAALEAK